MPVDWESLQLNGICLLCGKAMDERFYSGSYETYLTCGCELRKQLSDLHSKTLDIIKVADKRRAEMKRTADIVEMYQKLHALDPERKLDPQREVKDA